MPKIDITDNKRNEKSNLVLLFIYRIPKKNHESLIQLNNRVIDSFKKYGVQRFEVFQLESTEDMMEFTNIARTIEANKEDEEVWLEIQSYKNSQHVKEFIDKMTKDKSIETLYKEFMDLITPGSVVSFGGFDKIAEIS